MIYCVKVERSGTNETKIEFFKTVEGVNSFIIGYYTGYLQSICEKLKSNGEELKKFLYRVMNTLDTFNDEDKKIMSLSFHGFNDEYIKINSYKGELKD